MSLISNRLRPSFDLGISLLGLLGLLGLFDKRKFLKSWPDKKLLLPVADQDIVSLIRNVSFDAHGGDAAINFLLVDHLLQERFELAFTLSSNCFVAWFSRELNHNVAI